MTEGGGLQLDEAIDFQRREWGVQRILWVGALLVLVATMFGVFGEGPLSHAKEASSDGSVTLEIDRIVRHGAPASFELVISPDGVIDGEARVFITNQYLDDILIEQIDPQPSSVEADLERSVFVFTSATPGGPLVVSFEYRQGTNWWSDLEVGVVGHPSVTFRQLVLP